MTTVAANPNRIRVVKRDGYCLTNHRVLCRRGVIWLGQTCNLRCYFCYFADRVKSQHHPEHSFMPLDKAKDICRTLVEVYGNNSVDIQGGEPTIFPQICELLQYCNEIGLKPTLITNAVALNNRELCQRIKDAGVFDLLISLHGLGEVYDGIVGVKGASQRQMEGVQNCSELAIPFRVNITLTLEALSQLEELVQIALERGARAVNFIAFNPFIDQSDDQKRAKERIPVYTETASRLLSLIDRLSDSGIEVNVRYLPFCVFPEKYRKYVQNFQQIVYDLHEWETASEAWSASAPQRRAADPLSPPMDFFGLVMRRRAEFQACYKDQNAVRKGINQGMTNMRRKVVGRLEKKHPVLFRLACSVKAGLQRVGVMADDSGGGFRRSFYLLELGEVPDFSDLEYAYKEYRVLMTKTMHPYRKCATCDRCDLSPICDGFHTDYAALIGFEEAAAVPLNGLVYDPRFYHQEQLKVVEETEYGWALSCGKTRC